MTGEVLDSFASRISFPSIVDGCVPQDDGTRARLWKQFANLTLLSSRLEVGSSQSFADLLLLDVSALRGNCALVEVGIFSLVDRVGGRHCIESCPPDCRLAS